MRGEDIVDVPKNRSRWRPEILIWHDVASFFDAVIIIGESNRLLLGSSRKIHERYLTRRISSYNIAAFEIHR